MNKDACKDALRLVRDSLIDRNWHAYVRGFIEKIDPCRSMVNLFIGPSPRVRFINSERSHRNCLGNRYYDSSLPGVKPWIYFTVTNHSRREYFCLRIPILTLIARVSILNRIFLPFLFAVVLDRGNFRLEGLFPFVGSEVDDFPRLSKNLSVELNKWRGNSCVFETLHQWTNLNRLIYFSTRKLWSLFHLDFLNQRRKGWRIFSTRHFL